MAYKVIKHYPKHAVVKDEYWEKYYLVDVENSCTLFGSYECSWVKTQAQLLSNGYKTVEEFDYAWNGDFKTPIEMPKSLKQKQAELKNPKPEKPVGAKASSITEVIDKGTYTLVKTDNGKWGYFIPSTGQSKLELKDKSYAMWDARENVKKKALEELAKNGIDAGEDATDTLVKLYEKRVREAYGQAYATMLDNESRFLASFAAKAEDMMAQLNAGKITQEQYGNWLKTQSIMAARNEHIVEALAADLNKADKQAMAMLNGYMMPCYSENFNFATFQIEEATGLSTSFSLYNRQTVENLLKNPTAPLLPEVDDLSDMAWCKEKVSNCITQSVLLGESIPDAAVRLKAVVGMGANSAVRAARTALTGAQNLGRLDAARRAKAMGIELKKQWVATVDARTRSSHRSIDRETVDDLDGKFSNGCEFPGDPSAPGFEVWNCRCAMRFVLPGHEYDDLPEYSREGLKYEEWKNEKQLEIQAKQEKLQKQIDKLEAEKGEVLKTMPENKVYKGIWKDDTTLSQYESKLESIPKKKQYYLDKIATAPDGDVGYVVKKAAQINLDKLAEYEKLGKEYVAAQKAVSGQLEAIEKAQAKAKEKLGKVIGLDAFSDERKAAALKWTDKREADDFLRPLTSKAWLEATRAEKDAIWGYTNGSGKFNRPLSGFQGGWGSYNYKGIGNVDLDYEGGKQMIRDATNFMSRCSTTEDMWVVRGCGSGCMDSFFGLEFGGFEKLSDEQLASLVGHSNRVSGFMSCGTAYGSGFNGDIEMEIFIPKGTSAVYAEPFSSYTGANYNGRNWDGIQKQSRIGSEDETIIQRGASYTCTKVERRGWRYHVEFEVHPEQGYDLWGQVD